MTRTPRFLARDNATETVQIALRSGFDEQGAPQYGSNNAVSARVVEGVSIDNIPDGLEDKVELDVWMASGQGIEPEEDARLTWDGDTYTVLKVRKIRNLQRDVTHYRLWCGDDG